MMYLKACTHSSQRVYYRGGEIKPIEVVDTSMIRFCAVCPFLNPFYYCYQLYSAQIA